jgi:hypothetical protein
MMNDYRTPPGPHKPAQHFMRAVAAIVFGGITVVGFYVAIGGFTWAVRDGQSVRIPVLITGLSQAAAGLTFLAALRAGWLQGWPPQHEPKIVVGVFFMGLAVTVLGFL